MVYCIVVDGMYYVGVTKNSVKRRYTCGRGVGAAAYEAGTVYIVSRSGDLFEQEKELV